MHLAVLRDLTALAVKDVAGVVQPLPFRLGNGASDEINAVFLCPGRHGLDGFFVSLRGKKAEVFAGIRAVEHLRQHGEVRAALGRAPHEGRGFLHRFRAVEFRADLTDGDPELVVHSFSR